MKKRYLFVEFECPFCKEYLNVIDIVNSRLKPSDTIKIIDVTNSRATEVADNFLMEKYKIEDVPILFFDGFKISGVSSKDFIKEFLNALLKEEFEVE